MKKKSKEVNIIGLNKEIRSVFEKIEKVCKLYNGTDYEVTVTSGKDGVHKKGSKHYIISNYNNTTRDKPVEYGLLIGMTFETVIRIITEGNLYTAKVTNIVTVPKVKRKTNVVSDKCTNTFSLKDVYGS